MFPARRDLLIRVTVLIASLATALSSMAQENDPRSLWRRAASGIQQRIAGSKKVAGHSPQLGRIYSRAAQADHGRRNPVIVIPGILGSKLADEQTGKVAWGMVKLTQTRPFSSRAEVDLALPMRQGVHLRDLRDGVTATEILDDLEIDLLGAPFQVRAYHDVLGTLGVGGYRSQLSESLETVDYGEEHFTCFEFHYDWRRDCAENAAALAAFIEEKRQYVQQTRTEQFGTPADEPVRFDLVAHSMGGLIARYYLRYGSQPLPTDDRLPELTWEGAKRVETLILAGTPSAGSILSLEYLLEGMEYSKAFPKYPPAVLGTMPAVYQLLPRPRHRAVVDRETDQLLNLYDWQVWKDYGWGMLDPEQDSVLQRLMPGTDRETRLAVAEDHLRKGLWHAYQFHRAMDVPASPPPGTSLYLIAGDSESTKAQMTVSKKDDAIAFTDLAPGDGTVTRASTLMDERAGQADAAWKPRIKTPISWSGVHFIFTDHLGLTSSPAFADNALYLLLERPL